MPPYTKPHLTFSGQIQKLRDRGLHIQDDLAAEIALKRIGYYRLSAYLYTFRQVLPQPDEYLSARSNEFQAGYSLDHGLALWEFDRKLRHLVLQAVEQIEVGVRVRIAYEVGRDGAFTYLDTQRVEPRSLVPKQRKSGILSSDFDEWVDRLNRLRADSREDFIAHYDRKYSQHSPQLPVWIAIELWDFGALAHYYQGIMPYGDRLKVCQSFQVPNVKMFSSWLHILNMVRNTAAHHSRLWNKPLVIQPKLPKAGEIAAFDHVSPMRNRVGTTVYSALLIMAYMTSMLDPQREWVRDARQLFGSFPSVPGHSVGMMGFTSGWGSESAWN